MAPTSGVPTSPPAAAMLPLQEEAGSELFGFGPARTAHTSAAMTNKVQHVSDGQSSMAKVGAAAGTSGAHGPLGLVGSPHVSGTSVTTANTRRMEAGAAVSPRTSAPQSAPFELVEAPQKQALAAGAVAEGRMQGDRAGVDSKIQPNSAVPQTNMAPSHSGATVDSTEQTSQPLLTAHSRSESQDVFHDVCESK